MLLAFEILCSLPPVSARPRRVAAMSDFPRDSSSIDSSKKLDELEHPAPSQPANLSPVEQRELERLLKKDRFSSLFTVTCAGVALISDGLQNNIMTLTNGMASLHPRVLRLSTDL